MKTLDRRARSIDLGQEELAKIYDDRWSISMYLHSALTGTGILIRKVDGRVKKASFCTGKPHWAPNRSIPYYEVQANYLTGSEILKELRKDPEIRYAVVRLQERESREHLPPTRKLQFFKNEEPKEASKREASKSRRALHEARINRAFEQVSQVHRPEWGFF